MVQKQLIPQKSVAYYFLKSKDVNLENDLISITLFARLAREVTSFSGKEKRTQVETFWVQIDDVELDLATEKQRAMPNCMEKYEVSEEVFRHLLQLSKTCPNELFGVVPYYLKAEREMYVPMQEMEQRKQYC